MDKIIINSDPIDLEDFIIKSIITGTQNGYVNIELPDITSNIISSIYKKRGFAIALIVAEENNGNG